MSTSTQLSTHSSPRENVSSAHSHTTNTSGNNNNNTISQGTTTTPVRARRFANTMSQSFNQRPLVIKYSAQNNSSSTTTTSTTTMGISNNNQSGTTSSVNNNGQQVTSPIHEEVVEGLSPIMTWSASTTNTTTGVKSPTMTTTNTVDSPLVLSPTPNLTSPTLNQGSLNENLFNTSTTTGTLNTTSGSTTNTTTSSATATTTTGLTQTSPCLEVSTTSWNHCFKLSVPYIVVSSNKVKYQLILCVRDRNHIPPLSCQKRYSDILKFHQRLCKLMKMSREVQNLFPSKSIGFMVGISSKNSNSRKRKSSFEKYFDSLVEEIFTQAISQPLPKEWLYQIMTIVLEELFNIQFIEDVLNTLRKPVSSGTSTYNNNTNSTVTNAFKELESDLIKSLNLSISLKQMVKGTVFTHLNPHTSLIHQQITENSSNCKINTISEMVLQNQVNVLHVFCADRAKQEEFGISPVIVNLANGDEDRDIQNTEYQILKLNLNRQRDTRLSLDGILQSVVSAADVHITLKNYYLKLEFEELISTDPTLKQLLEKGEKCKTEFLEDGLKQVFVNSIFDENSGSKISFNDGDVQQVKKMLETLSALSKQAKEIDMKYSILFTQLLKAVNSVDKQLIQKTVEQINLKSQAISSINEKVTEALKYWYQFMEQKTNKIITEREGFHQQFILVFLLPLCFSVVSYKISCVPQVLKLFLGLCCESICTEMELMTENELYMLGGLKKTDEQDHQNSTPGGAAGHHTSGAGSGNPTQSAATNNNNMSSLSSPTSPSEGKKKKKNALNNDEEQLTLPKSLFGTNPIHALKVMTLLCESQYSPFSYCVEFLKKLWNTIISESSKAVDDWQNVHYVLHEEERKLTRLFLSLDDDSAVDDFFNIQELTKQKLERVAKKLKLSSECYNISHHE
ncbi:hypothetical protein C9374_009722 [Naegleria lovaniensis]|uniref:PX domain-containing protein n=1 Tax=Naegleria lovaniensis TaxID=51637 RepID=A0AA88KXA3_NAELO|nr:uncharacterized protein C9374_009722 [Naegleria lovaniensis]KAG2393145.1 hypothetical protein C9374_009722 [Naegleria lovaniensis]